MNGKQRVAAGLGLNRYEAVAIKKARMAELDKRAAYSRFCIGWTWLANEIFNDIQKGKVF